MSKRNKLSGINPFGINKDDAEKPTLLDVDAEIFGDLARVDAGRIEVKNIRIFDILPDPTQPRRAIPSSVRIGWDGQPNTVGDVLAKWLELVDAERGQPFPLVDHLNFRIGDNIPEDEPIVGPLESAFLEIVRLAVSIKQDGLTNPITVFRAGRQFMLETGERRWLAFHLLYHWTRANESEQAASSWEKIPARVMDEFSVWRQASENNARANLNAIAKARQFAILMMDLLVREGDRFRSYQEIVSTGHPEQDFYAQVVEKSPPYGRSELILSAMGVKHRNAILRYRRLLQLPNEVWLLADDHNWTERQLRPLVPPTPPKRAIELARQMAGLSPVGDNFKKTQKPYDAWRVKRIPQLQRDLKKMSKTERRELLEALRKIIDEYGD